MCLCFCVQLQMLDFPGIISFAPSALRLYSGKNIPFDLFPENHYSLPTRKKMES